MKIQSILSTITFIVLGFTTISCEGVLDQKPRGVLADGTLNAEFTDKLVTSSYQGLAAHYFGNFESFVGPSTNWVMDVRSDDAWKGGGGVSDLIDVHQLEVAAHDATNAVAFHKWRNNLYAIARTNLAIRELNKINDPAYPVNTRIAEMRFLRGLFHFDLKRNFNQIPYLIETTDALIASNTEYTDSQLWELIEADLQFAYDNLPPTQEQVGRATKYAAAGFLQKLYLHTEDWTNAKAMGDAIINSGNYALLNEFENLSTLAYENGAEGVFVVQYSTANIYANHNWSNLLNSTSGPGIDNGAYASGDDFYHASFNLVNAFKTDADGHPLFDSFNDGTKIEDATYSGTIDPRLDFTVGRIGIPWKGTANYDENWVRSIDYYPGFSGKKHVVAPNDPMVHNSWPWAASGLNFNVIRYADVLLMTAEANIELGNTADGISLINEVRNRAKNSTPVKHLTTGADAANYKIEPYTTSGWSQSEARTAVRFERRIELALEGHRWYDLLRWGQLQSTMSNYYTTESVRKDYLEGAVFTLNRDEFLPIPQSEIDLAPSLYTQNQGY